MEWIAIMGKKSAEVISLPKGGGAQRGIGEKFASDLQTGTGNFTVPVGLPAGRNGFQPQVNLSYASGHGNGHSGSAGHSIFQVLPAKHHMVFLVTEMAY